MSPLAAVALAREQGVATVVHVSCRDRNRMALQSQVVGAAALGSEGVLCLHGDAVEGVPRVKDLTATSLIAKAKEWAHPHELAVGAVVNPFAPDLHRELRLLEKKLAAGADFLQSQMVFDLDALQRFFADASDLLAGGCGSMPASAYCGRPAWLTTCDGCPDVCSGVRRPEDQGRRRCRPCGRTCCRTRSRARSRRPARLSTRRGSRNARRGSGVPQRARRVRAATGTDQLTCCSARKSEVTSTSAALRVQLRHVSGQWTQPSGAADRAIPAALSAASSACAGATVDSCWG